jgi:hypothetical protein
VQPGCTIEVVSIPPRYPLIHKLVNGPAWEIARNLQSTYHTLELSSPRCFAYKSVGLNQAQAVPSEILLRTRVLLTVDRFDIWHRQIRGLDQILRIRISCPACEKNLGCDHEGGLSDVVGINGGGETTKTSGFQLGEFNVEELGARGHLL